MSKPDTRPGNANFSSGPCTKHPGWRIADLAGALVGRSHRSKPAKAKLALVIENCCAVLDLPDDYRIGIMPASDTGAFEIALWSMLGDRGVDDLVERFAGKDAIELVQGQLDAVVRNPALGEVVGADALAAIAAAHHAPALGAALRGGLGLLHLVVRHVIRHASELVLHHAQRLVDVRGINAAVDGEGAAIAVVGGMRRDVVREPSTLAEFHE